VGEIASGAVAVTKSKPAPARKEEAPAGTLFWALTPQQAAILAAIVIVTIAIYLPSMRNGWVFDDWQEFVDNKLIHNWSFVWNSFRYDSWWFLEPRQLPASAYYRPLENTWFAANALLFGTHPAAWHLTKIALHAVAVILCFRVAQLLTGEVVAGLIAAAIFGVMPAHTGGVVWASAIPEPLSTVFELGAMTFLIGRKPGWSRGLFIALILYACATLTHESAILFPLIVFAYAFIFESDENVEGAGTRRRIVKALLVCAPFVAVAIAYICARLNALGANYMFGVPPSATGTLVLRGFVVLKAHHTPAEILMTMPVVLIAYLAILTLPQVAGPTHEVRWITHPAPIVFVSAAALVVLAAAAIVAAWRSPRRRIFLFCAAWSLFTIAPALNLDALWWPVDDRYLYAPSFGWSLAVAVAVLQIAAAGATARKAVGVAMAALLAMYAISTMRTERYWYDDVAFFQRCVEIAPRESDYRVRLAAAMNKAGNPEQAAAELEAGTALDPDDVHLHLKLAQQYKMMGREVEFEQEFQKFNQLSQAKVERERAAPAAGASQPADAP